MFWPSGPCFFLIGVFNSWDPSYLSSVILSLLFCFVNGHAIRTIMPSEEVAWLTHLSNLKVFHYSSSSSMWNDFNHAHQFPVVQTSCKSLFIRDKPAMLFLGLDWIMHNLHRCFLPWPLVPGWLWQIWLGPAYVRSVHNKPQVLTLLGVLALFWPIFNLGLTFHRPTQTSAWSCPSASSSSSLTNLKSTAALHRAFIPALKWQTLIGAHWAGSSCGGKR